PIALHTRTHLSLSGWFPDISRMRFFSSVTYARCVCVCLCVCVCICVCVCLCVRTRKTVYYLSGDDRCVCDDAMWTRITHAVHISAFIQPSPLTAVELPGLRWSRSFCLGHIFCILFATFLFLHL